MRALFSAVAVALISAGVAAGQEDPPPEFVAQWERTARGQDYAENFPQNSIAPGAVAFAVLCCSVRENRFLQCTVPVAAPANAGFESATIAVSRHFRLTEASYAEYMAGPRRPIRRVITWNVAPTPSDLAARRQAVDAATAHVCEMAAAASPSPAN